MSKRRKVKMGLCANAVRSWYACYGFGGASYVRYSGCGGVRVVRAVVRSDVNIAFDETCVVVVLNINSV